MALPWWRAVDASGQALDLVQRRKLAGRFPTTCDGEGRFEIEVEESGSYVLVATHSEAA